MKNKLQTHSHTWVIQKILYKIIKSISREKKKSGNAIRSEIENFKGEETFLGEKKQNKSTPIIKKIIAPKKDSRRRKAHQKRKLIIKRIHFTQNID